MNVLTTYLNTWGCGLLKKIEKIQEKVNYVTKKAKIIETRSITSFFTPQMGFKNKNRNINKI